MRASNSENQVTKYLNKGSNIGAYSFSYAVYFYSRKQHWRELSVFKSVCQNCLQKYLSFPCLNSKPSSICALSFPQSLQTNIRKTNTGQQKVRNEMKMSQHGMGICSKPKSFKALLHTTTLLSVLTSALFTSLSQSKLRVAESLRKRNETRKLTLLHNTVT